MTATSTNRGKPVGLLAFNLLAILVGLVSGLGAVVFRGLIAVFHNLLFLGQFSFHLRRQRAYPGQSRGESWVILVPVVGAAGVAFLVGKFAPEAKGHGVPEVMDAIYYNNGIIRPVVAVIKSLASALSIGSGGSIGREGPIIQIGSSFGSTMGQIIRMPPWQRITLIAAGAGAGIAATFNTPIGGVLFAVEIMLHEVSARTLIPLAISTATATYVGRLCFGPYPSFVIPALETPYFHVANLWLLLSFVGLGILLGIVSAGLHQVDLRLRGLLRAAGQGKLLHAPHDRDASGGHHHVSPDGLVGPLLHRGRRIRDHPGRAHRQASRRSTCCCCCLR